MTEKMKKDIRDCIQDLKKGKQETATSEMAAAYAEGYLQHYPELAELLHTISYAGVKAPE